MLLYFFLQLLIDCIIKIELLDCSKEIGKSLVIVEVAVKVFELVKDFVELPHNNRKDSHTTQQNPCSNQSLKIASWHIISKAHSGQRGEGEVAQNYCVSW